MKHMIKRRNETKECERVKERQEYKKEMKHIWQKAVVFRNLEGIQKGICSRVIDINQSFCDKTPLEMMCISGNEECVVAMVEAKANVNNGILSNPFEDACKSIYMNFNIIQALVEAKAETQGIHSQSAIRFALRTFCTRYETIETVQMAEFLLKLTSPWVLSERFTLASSLYATDFLDLTLRHHNMALFSLFDSKV